MAKDKVVRRALPPFRDEKAILALFEDREAGPAYLIWKLTEGWLDYDYNGRDTAKAIDLSDASFERAIVLAERGEPGDLIRLEKARLKKTNGRPIMTREEKLRESSTHTAASMFHLIKFLLQYWYPDQPTEKIKERAILIATKICNEQLLVLAPSIDKTELKKKTLRGYLSRGPKDPRRLV